MFLSMYVGLATLSDVTGAYYLGEGIAALFFGAFVADKIDPVDNE